MELFVYRAQDDGKAVMGEMYVNGMFECYTLEPSSKADYPTIPAGTYRVQLLMSPRFKQVTPHIQGVPGRSWIEIHPGNAPNDTEGCTLVGETKALDWVGSSRVAFLKLMAELENQTDISIAYQDYIAPDLTGEISV